MKIHIEFMALLRIRQRIICHIEHANPIFAAVSTIYYNSSYSSLDIYGTRSKKYYENV